jgi:hypothetical protein
VRVAQRNDSGAVRTPGGARERQAAQLPGREQQPDRYSSKRRRHSGSGAKRPASGRPRAGSSISRQAASSSSGV